MRDMMTEGNSSLNVFFTDNYQRAAKGKVVFILSQDFAIPIRLYEKGVFKSATLLSEPCHYAEHGETEEAFLNVVVGFIKRNYKVQWIAETPASGLFTVAPADAMAIPFGSHIVDLSNDVDTLWSMVHSKHRNVVKKAEKEGVEIVKGTDDKLLNDYHAIDIETWERSNVKANGVEHLKSIVETMGENVVFYIAYKDGEPQAGAIF